MGNCHMYMGDPGVVDMYMGDMSNNMGGSNFSDMGDIAMGGDEPKQSKWKKNQTRLRLKYAARESSARASDEAWQDDVDGIGRSLRRGNTTILNLF